MSYAEGRERREARGRAVEDPTRRRRDPEGVSPSLKVGGLLLGLFASIFSLMLGSLGLVVAVCILVAGVVILLQELRRLDRRAPRSRPGFGAEKQLLLALRDSGGLTAVEAALETSLTVDEADDILSRLAERGHLSVESRDGALCYALPGGRNAGVSGPLQEPGGRTL